jgi:uncharacterized membrane protein
MTATLVEHQQTPPPLSGTCYMDATIRPHRALSERGLMIVMLSLIAVSFVAGVSFIMMGGWPVAGFLGLDILLIWIAMRYTARRLDKQHETVRIQAERIHITRTDVRGKTRHWTLSPAFAKVLVEQKEDFPPNVAVACGGQALGVGEALSPSERLSLAKAIEKAIGQARAERYSGEQDGA